MSEHDVNCHICGKPKTGTGGEYCSYPHGMVPDAPVNPEHPEGMWTWKKESEPDVADIVRELRVYGGDTVYSRAADALERLSAEVATWRENEVEIGRMVGHSEIASWPISHSVTLRLAKLEARLAEAVERCAKIADDYDKSAAFTEPEFVQSRTARAIAAAIRSRLGGAASASTRAEFDRIIAALRYDGPDENSLTVGEIRRAL